MSWMCSSCGELHDELPLSFAADYPDHFANLSGEDRERRALIGSDQCIIDEKEFYLRGMIELPIRGSSEKFLWGVWAAMHPEDFAEVADSWEESGREVKYGPYKAGLGNALHAYSPSALNLKLTIHMQPVGQRPLFVLEEPDHPLAVAQQHGMSQSEVHTLVAKLLHSSR